jgi:hypothetical protein
MWGRQQHVSIWASLCAIKGVPGEWVAKTLGCVGLEEMQGGFLWLEVVWVECKRVPAGWSLVQAFVVIRVRRGECVVRIRRRFRYMASSGTMQILDPKVEEMQDEWDFDSTKAFQARIHEGVLTRLPCSSNAIKTWLGLLMLVWKQWFCRKADVWVFLWCGRMLDRVSLAM